MLNGKKIIAIISARRGSKRLPGKNIKEINGFPLVVWSFIAAKKSKYIDRIIVSTDDTSIIKIAKEYKIDAPFVRPSRLATNKISSEKVILHAIKWLEDKEGDSYDYLVSLQPTSPLRCASHIDAAIKKIENDKNAKTLVSVSKIQKSPYWIKRADKKGFLHNFICGVKNWHKKNISSLYLPNGAIFVCSTRQFKKESAFYTNKSIYYEMDEISSIDIDTDFDFEIAEFFMKTNNCSTI